MFMKHFNKRHSSSTRRRESVIEKLENQLKLGLKQPKGTVMAMDKIPLLLVDVKRIKQELATLHSRV